MTHSAQPAQFAQRIGVTLTEEFQLVPEESTDALIAFHPEARYFSA